MSSHKVLLVGATGETGQDVLNGLLEDGSFDLTALIRPASAEKPAVAALKQRGVKVLILDINAPIDTLIAPLSGFKTVISTIFPDLDAQLKLADVLAKVEPLPRFIPCDWGTACPPGGIMALFDWKENIHHRILQNKIPYTFIDVGYWHQISFPRLPSGKLDYAIPGLLLNKSPAPLVYGTGEVQSMLSDKRDIGRFTALIIKDERTLNKKVAAHSDCLSQLELIAIAERISGEKLGDPIFVSEEKLLEQRAAAYEESKKETGKPGGFKVYGLDYIWSKNVRGDNTVENAKYLGYVIAKELYPNFKAITFEEAFKEVLEGKGNMPYKGRF